jgi:hypothetical protein
MGYMRDKIEKLRKPDFCKMHPWVEAVAAWLYKTSKVREDSWVAYPICEKCKEGLLKAKGIRELGCNADPLPASRPELQTRL